MATHICLIHFTGCKKPCHLEILCRRDVWRGESIEMRQEHHRALFEVKLETVVLGQVQITQDAVGRADVASAKLKQEAVGRADVASAKLKQSVGLTWPAPN